MKRILILLFTFIFLPATVQGSPKLTVVFVVDQLASHYLTKLGSKLNGGIHKFMNQGIVYSEAYHPLGKPNTAAGHVSIATGTVPALHGIVSNSWYEDGKKVVSDTDKHGKKSAEHQQIPTLTEHFLKAHPHNRSYALSYKSRSAIGLAGKNAPAIWFDKKTGKFRSSKKFFAITPEWLSNFNQKHPLLNKKKNTWDLRHTDKKYYDFPCIDNYQYSRLKTLFKSGNLISRAKSPLGFIKQFMLTPDANQTLLDLSYQVIADTFDKNPDAHLLIWIGLSSLDKVGHRFGPQSKEAVDTIYHLDTQMDSFMDQLAKVVSPKQTFYVLTADHGIMPIPELLKQCYNKKNPGQRVLIHEVKDLINKDIKQQYGVGHVVSALPAPYVYLNQEKLDALPPAIQFNILGRIKEILESIPGIKNVYSAQDLYIQALKRGSTKWLFANQMYPRRSGHFVLEVEPGVLLAKRTKGAGHNSPSDYNLHVPLVFYQPQVSNHRVINKKVWIPQMTRTLATILNVEAPSPYSMAELPD